MNSEASFYDDGNTSRIRRRSSNSSIRRATSDSSSESGSGGGSSDSDGSSEEEDEGGNGDDGGEGYHDKAGSMIVMTRQEAPKFTVDVGTSVGTRGHNEVCWHKNSRR